MQQRHEQLPRRSVFPALSLALTVLLSTPAAGQLPGVEMGNTNKPPVGALFISGTVRDDAGAPVAGAVVGSLAITDSSGHFSLPVQVPGTRTIDILADGYDRLEASVEVVEGRPTFGLEFVLARNPNSRPLAERRLSGPLTIEELRELTRQAAAEWAGNSANLLRALDVKVGLRFGNPELTVSSIPLSTSDDTVFLLGPYGFYRFQLAERLRRFEDYAALTLLEGVAVVVAPTQMDAPDIIRVVVQRHGQVVEPLEVALAPEQFQNQMGATTTKHAGFVVFPLNVFDPGGSVVVIAVPDRGTNLELRLSSGDLARLR